MPSFHCLTNQNIDRNKVVWNDFNSKKTEIYSINQHLFKNNFIFRPPFILRTSIFGFIHDHKISFTFQDHVTNWSCDQFRVINDNFIF